jgi:hypothetical protein
VKAEAGTAHTFFVYRKKVECRDRRKEERRLTADDRCWTMNRQRQQLCWSPSADPYANRQAQPLFSHRNACKTASSVEKRLHIHSSECAEAGFLLSRLLLSKIGSAWIQCFSSASGST